jgi:hypothetical protein
MIGSEITLFISYFLAKGQAGNIHLYIDLGCACLAFLQLILAIFVLPELPMDLLASKQEIQLNAVMAEMYNEEDIPRRLV